MSDSITRWNPVNELTSMQQMMERFFDDMWRPFASGDAGTHALAIDDNNYTVVTSLPGVKADDVNVRLDGNMLVIEGEIPEEQTSSEDKRTLIRERHYGKFLRSIRLPQSVDTEKVEAVYDDGVLTLTLPKVASVKSKVISVKSQKK